MLLCVQVAGFLQDEATASAACKQFRDLLLPPQSLLTRKGTPPAPAEAVEVLLSLLPELAAAMLHTHGDNFLGHWVSVLPPSCLPLSVAATLTDDQPHLHIQPHTSKDHLWHRHDLARIAGAVETLQSRVVSLHIGDDVKFNELDRLKLVCA